MWSDLLVFQDSYLYSRWANPTCDAAGHVLNSLEGGEGTLMYSSGMAAISTALLALLKAGDHLVSGHYMVPMHLILLSEMGNKSNTSQFGLRAEGRGIVLYVFFKEGHNGCLLKGYGK